MEFLLSLRSRNAQLGKAVQRCAHSKEPLQHAGKQKRAAPGELVLVDLHFNSNAAREAHSLFRDQAREMRLAADIQDALNDVLRVGRPADIVEP